MRAGGGFAVSAEDTKGDETMFIISASRNSFGDCNFREKKGGNDCGDDEVRFRGDPRLRVEWMFRDGPGMSAALKLISSRNQVKRVYLRSTAICHIIATSIPGSSAQ
jgi:hypothetical protein